MIPTPIYTKLLCENMMYKARRRNFGCKLNGITTYVGTVKLFQLPCRRHFIHFSDKS